MECRQIVARLVQSGSDVQPRAQMAAESKSTLGPKLQERLAAALNDVMRLAPKPRGFAFEQFLNDLFGAFKLAPRPPFRLVGEQIEHFIFVPMARLTENSKLLLAPCARKLCGLAVCTSAIRGSAKTV